MKSTPQRTRAYALGKAFQVGVNKLGLNVRVRGRSRDGGRGTAQERDGFSSTSSEGKLPVSEDMKHDEDEGAVPTQGDGTPREKSVAEVYHDVLLLPSPLPYHRQEPETAFEDKTAPQIHDSAQEHQTPEAAQNTSDLPSYEASRAVQDHPAEDICVGDPSPLPLPQAQPQPDLNALSVDESPESDEEIFEPRAAYDFVDFEPDETDSPVLEGTGSLQREHELDDQRRGEHVDQDGWCDAGESVVMDEDEYFFEQSFRLTPCAELEEDEEEEEERERRVRVLKEPMIVSITAQAEERTTSTVTAVNEQQEKELPATPAPLETLGQELQKDVENEAQKTKPKEREMSLEEEVNLVAHWEKRREVCERHATTLEQILSANQSNKTWLERGGLDVDELLRCLRWTPEGFVELAQEVKALNLTLASSTSSSLPLASSQSNGTADGELQKERGVTAGEGPLQSERPGLEEEVKKGERQRKLRELRRQHRKNARTLLENTKKVDEMMAVLQDLVKAMSEAADKRRAERQKMKEKEREEVRTRRVETAKGKGRAGVPEKARDKAQDKEIQKQRTSNISLATASQPSTTKLGSSRAYRQRLPSSQRPAVTPTRGKSSHSLPTISPAVTASSKPVPNKSRSFWAAAGASANLDKALLDFRIFPTRRVSVTTKA